MAAALGGQAGRRTYARPCAPGSPSFATSGRASRSTPRAVELREEVGALLRDCDNVLRPGAGFEAAHLQRTFTVQATDLLSHRWFREHLASAVLALTEPAPAAARTLG